MDFVKVSEQYLIKSNGLKENIKQLTALITR